jgi:SAM-dependent methyltransferase
MTGLRELCNGVLEGAESEIEGAYPENIVWNDRSYSRFMNIFYIDRPCDELTTDQVQVLCRARNNRRASIGEVNTKVRAVLRLAIFDLAPRRALEIGAGNSPVMTVQEALEHQIDYVISDGDETNSTEVFSGDRATLGYETNTLDMVVALFVLHFKFFDSQISEIARCLAEDGVFLANMYRREQSSRLLLIGQMKKHNLTVKIVKDLHLLCNDHEYWFIGKNPSRLDSIANAFCAKHFDH